MSMMDPSAASIERLAQRACDHVMDKLYRAVRDAVEMEVRQELADREDFLNSWESRVVRMQQNRMKPQMPSGDLVSAASQVAAALVALENAQFSSGERAAKAALDKAHKALCEAVNKHQILSMKD